MIVRVVPTHALDPTELGAIRALLSDAFGDGFSEEDWEHSLGGIHVVLWAGHEPSAHASVVPRPLEVPGRELAAGYVEAVATRRDLQGGGLGTRVMRTVAEVIHERFEIGALSTGLRPFYERLGWEVWRGPTHVRTADGWERTPAEDGTVMALRTHRTPPLDLDAPISCEWRPGDVW